MTASRFSIPWLAALALLGGACTNNNSVPPAGSGGGPGPASGGSPGLGAATGSGGQPGTGGAPATGGRTGSGGQPGTGGAPATGGRTGSGGTTAAGGVTGSGGAAGAGGQTSSGGAVGGSGSGGTSGTAGTTGSDAGRDGPPGSGGSGSGGSGSGGSGSGGSGSGGTTGAAGSSGSGVDGGGGESVKSAGCGKTPTLKKSGSSNFTPNTLSVAGTSREYVIRWPDNYDNTHAYRLHLTLHGYGGSYSETAGNYFGLWSLSNNTTIFIALSAISSDWRTGDNLAYVDAVLKAVEDDLCIDTSRVTLEGFSQGAAMSWTLACSRPGVFRAAVGHSGGGVTNPTKCDPIPYLGSGGLQESVTQTTQTDQFAKWNGCTIETFAKAPTGGHACYDYKGCSDGHPVRWCNYDGPHTPSPTDSGKTTSWMPSEVWPFLTQF
jgi:poly(3-hydroxybutyrate) depolymerase